MPLRKVTLADTLAEQFRLAFPFMQQPERERLICSGRKWRADLAWPLAALLVECEGGIWNGRAGFNTRGRHTGWHGFMRDLEKYNAACVAGYRLLRVTGDMIKSGEALRLITAALASP